MFRVVRLSYGLILEHFIILKRKHFVSHCLFPPPSPWRLLCCRSDARRVRLFATPQTAARQASLAFSISQNLSDSYIL